MPFNANVVTTCNWNDVPDQVRKKVNEIADDQGRNNKGQVTFNNGTKCVHWAAGDYRIFGTYAANAFTFIGYGTHVGKGDNKYDVSLCGGGKTRAQTS